MSIDIRLLQDALRAQPSDIDEPEIDLEVERMGDEAFDWIAGELSTGSLAPSENVRGLRLLARLTRQFCLRRKGELLDLVMTIAQSRTAHPDVRSTAAHIAIMNARIAKGLRDASAAYNRSVDDVEAQVSQAIRVALEIGLSPHIEAFAKEFLSASTRTG